MTRELKTRKLGVKNMKVQNGQLLLKRVATWSLHLCYRPTSNDFWNSDYWLNQGFNVIFRRNFNDRETDSYFSLLQLLNSYQIPQNRPDNLLLRGSPCGKFSGQISKPVPPQNYCNKQQLAMEMTWKNKAPPPQGGMFQLVGSTESMFNEK